MFCSSFSLKNTPLLLPFIVPPLPLFMHRANAKPSHGAVGLPGHGPGARAREIWEQEMAGK